MAWKKFTSRTGETIMTPESRVKDIERIGYEIAGKKPVEKPVKEPEGEAVETQAKTPEELDYTLKPISEWTREECTQYIKENNIDLGGAKKPEKIREIIQRHIESKR